MRIPIVGLVVSCLFVASALAQTGFQCRIENARDQCAEREQCVPRLLLHAKARYGPTV